MRRRGEAGDETGLWLSLSEEMGFHMASHNRQTDKLEFDEVQYEEICTVNFNLDAYYSIGYFEWWIKRKCIE